jgi:hypothetical protein
VPFFVIAWRHKGPISDQIRAGFGVKVKFNTPLEEFGAILESEARLIILDVVG